MRFNKAAGSELEDDCTVDGVKLPVERVERSLIAESGLLDPAASAADPAAAVWINPRRVTLSFMALVPLRSSVNTAQSR